MSSGLSDFHELVLTVMKTIFPKAKLNEIFYRNYKNFNETIFKDDFFFFFFFMQITPYKASEATVV